MFVGFVARVFCMVEGFWLKKPVTPFCAGNELMPCALEKLNWLMLFASGKLMSLMLGKLLGELEALLCSDREFALFVFRKLKALSSYR